MIWGIQYLRAVAALAVVLFHGGDGGKATVYTAQAGVDVFFVVSGFIMWTVATKRETSPFEFARHRIARIVPLYWIVTLLIFAANRIIPKIVPTISWQRPSDLILSMLFIPHPDHNGFWSPVVLQGWTIEIEVAFYVVVTLALSLPRRWRLSTVLIGVVAMTPWHSVAIEFAAGVLIAATPWRPKPRMAVVLLALGLLCFVMEEVFAVKYSVWRPVVWGGPATAIVLGVLSLESLLPRFPLLRRIGDASYSIYLIHIPFVVAAQIAMPQPWSTITAMIAVTVLALAMRGPERWLQDAVLGRIKLRSRQYYPIQ